MRLPFCLALLYVIAQAGCQEAPHVPPSEERPVEKTWSEARPLKAAKHAPKSTQHVYSARTSGGYTGAVILSSDGCEPCRRLEADIKRLCEHSPWTCGTGDDCHFKFVHVANPDFETPRIEFYRDGEPYGGALSRYPHDVNYIPYGGEQVRFTGPIGDILDAHPKTAKKVKGPVFDAARPLQSSYRESRRSWFNDGPDMLYPCRTDRVQTMADGSVWRLWETSDGDNQLWRREAYESRGRRWGTSSGPVYYSARSSGYCFNGVCY